MKTITIKADTRDSVRFDTFYDRVSQEFQIIKTTILRVGSYSEDVAARLTASWDDVYFEPTSFNYTRVFIEGNFVGELAFLPDKNTRAWFIDRRVQDAVDMPFDSSGFPYGHAAQKAVLEAWKAKCAANGKVFHG